jgi:hypothetical protein
VTHGGYTEEFLAPEYEAVSWIKIRVLAKDWF